MKTPSSAHRVLSSTMVIIILLYVVFGVLGYIVYGSGIQGSVTLNLVGTKAVERMYVCTTRRLTSCVCDN